MSETPSLSYSELSIASLPRKVEKSLVKRAGKNHYVIGVDEAGRGPLAGPVVAAAFAFLVPGKGTPDEMKCGITDSKQVSEEAREFLYSNVIRDSPDVVFKTAIVSNKDIDKINILQATFRAMSEAVLNVIEEIKKRNPSATFSILIDGNKIPPQIASLKDLYAQCVIKGDSIEFVIAAASICAKVERDEIMRTIDDEFPLYGFRQHKGYPTGSHVAAISRQGPCKYHRMTFAPLKNIRRRHQKDTKDEELILQSALALSSRAERAKRRETIRMI